jgi:hypothetical protein
VKQLWTLTQNRSRRGHDRMVVGFLKMQLVPITTNVVSSNHLRRSVLNTTLCDKDCQWLAAGRWAFPGIPVSFTDKIDRHDITEILLKVALISIILIAPNQNIIANTAFPHQYASTEVTEYFLGRCWHLPKNFLKDRRFCKLLTYYFSMQNTMTLLKVWIQTAKFSIGYELWNINSIRCPRAVGKLQLRRGNFIIAILISSFLS